MKYKIKLLLTIATAGLLLTSCYTQFAASQSRQAWDSYDIIEAESQKTTSISEQDTFYTDDGEQYIGDAPIYSPEINYYYFDGSPYWDSWSYDPYYFSFHFGYYPPYYGSWYGWYPSFPVVYYPVYIYDPYYWDYPPYYVHGGYDRPFQPRPFGRGGTILARGDGSKRISNSSNAGRPRKSRILPPPGDDNDSNSRWFATRSIGSKDNSDGLTHKTIRKTSTGNKTSVSRTSGSSSKRKYYRVKKISNRSTTHRTPTVKKVSRTNTSKSSGSYTSPRSHSSRSYSSGSSRSRSSGSRSSVSRSSTTRSSVTGSSSGRSVSRSSSSRSSSSRSGSSRSSRRR